MPFICIDTFGNHVVGYSLDEAFSEYSDAFGLSANEGLTFYEASEIEVEVKIVKKETIVKKGK